MTQEQKIIRAKVGLLELAKQLGNVSQACKGGIGPFSTVSASAAPLSRPRRRSLRPQHSRGQSQSPRRQIANLGFACTLTLLPSGDGFCLANLCAGQV
jgi:hypothetical protein